MRDITDLCWSKVRVVLTQQASEELNDIPFAFFPNYGCVMVRAMLIQKCRISLLSCQLLLIDVSNCLCFYVAHTEKSLSRLVRVKENNIVPECKNLTEKLHSILYSPKSRSSSRSQVLIEKELHAVRVILIQAFCEFPLDQDEEREPRLVLTLDAIGGNTSLYMLAFQHWSQALVRMSLDVVCHHLIQMHMSPSTSLGQFLENTMIQSKLNSSESPRPSPAVDPGLDEADTLLWDSQLPTPRLPFKPDKSLSASSPHSTAATRTQSERDRLEEIEAIKSGELPAKHRTARQSKAARF